MKVVTFVPNRDAAKDLFLKNFASKLPQYAAKYGISAAEVTDMQQCSAHFTYWLNYKNQLEELNRKLTSYKNEIRDGILPGATPSTVPTLPNLGAVPTPVAPGVFDRTVSIAKRILNHINYTVADGRDLGIENVTPKPQVDISAVKPVIKARLVDNGDVEIAWTKKHMDAIEIYVDRGEGFDFLAYDAHPNYTDANTLEPGVTAVWKYKAVYLKHDRQVGVMSDEVQITVTGSYKSSAA